MRSRKSARLMATMAVVLCGMPAEAVTRRRTTRHRLETA
jgi:hypothetical protein